MNAESTLLHEDSDVHKNPDITLNADDKGASQTNKSKSGETQFEKEVHRLQEVERENLAEIETFYSPEVLTPTMVSKKDGSHLSDPSKFYNTILSNNKELGTVIHGYITTILTSEDKGKLHDSRIYLTAQYWNFLEYLLDKKIPWNPDTIVLFRYAILVPSAVPKTVLSYAVHTNIDQLTALPLYYLDEWLKAISARKVPVSSMIQENVEQSGERYQNQIEQMTSLLESQITAGENINQELDFAIESLSIKAMQVKDRLSSQFSFNLPLNESQIRDLKDISELSRSIQNKSESLGEQIKIIEKSQGTIHKLKQDLDSISSSEEDGKDDSEKAIASITIQELYELRQMAKICVGNRGNHLPILFEKYFSGQKENFGTKQRILEIFRSLERLDYSVFYRVIKGVKTRKFPNIIIIPCYGAKGFCWEPYDKFQKNVSSAKLIVPMYSQDLYKAIVYTLGDYRWQIARELAGQLWMEEGLTGRYFNWFSSNVNKGSIKSNFIENYQLWMYWESRGIQKIHKQLRKIFWQYVPFTTEVKQSLSRRSVVYDQLIQNDNNRVMSSLF